MLTLGVGLDLAVWAWAEASGSGLGCGGFDRWCTSGLGGVGMTGCAGLCWMLGWVWAV